MKASDTMKIFIVIAAMVYVTIVLFLLGACKAAGKDDRRDRK